MLTCILLFLSMGCGLKIKFYYYIIISIIHLVNYCIYLPIVRPNSLNWFPLAHACIHFRLLHIIVMYHHNTIPSNCMLKSLLIQCHTERLHHVR